MNLPRLDEDRRETAVPRSILVRSPFSRLMWGLGVAGVAAICFLGSELLAATPKRSALAPKPEWSQLEPFQQTLTREEFLHLLNTIYAPGGAWKQTITVGTEAATIHAPGSKKPEFRLRFAQSKKERRPLPRYWKPAGNRGANPKRPLEGYTIAIDPGHIGGAYAKMEERWFRIGDSKPVMEGEMVLKVAFLLEKQLGSLGARVVLLRRKNEPVTRVRPKDLRQASLAELRRKGITKVRQGYNGSADPLKFNSLQWQSELLFYRVSEIRTRARLVNETIKPDLVICLHFNAEDWGDPLTPRLTEKNHLHMLVNGNYGSGELAFEDIRFDMLLKLLNQSAKEELPLSDSVADALASGTGLPPFTYNNAGRARRVTGNQYVWGRNLLANRLYHCPVVFCEPYVMNSQPVFDRVQLGDYSGTRVIDGKARKSIFREYADAVTQGVRHYFEKRAKPWGCPPDR